MVESVNAASNTRPSEEETIREQIDLLANWNKENISVEPEQARKNFETILLAVKNLNGVY